MEFNIKFDSTFNEHVNEVLKLKGKNDFSIMKKYIRPYITNEDVYNKSYQELYDEFIETMTEEECKAACEEIAPDVPVIPWFDYKIFFILDWSDDYWTINTWDYVTVKNMEEWGVTKEELLLIAITNMEKNENIYYRRIDVSEIEDLKNDLYILSSRSTVTPSCGNSAILSDIALKKIYHDINEPFYCYMFDKSKIFIVPNKDIQLGKTNLLRLKNIIQKSRFYSMEFFSDEILYFDGQNLESK